MNRELPIPHWYQWPAIGPLFLAMLGLEGVRRLIIRLQGLITDVARWVLT